MRLIDADELMEKTIGVVVYDEGGWDCNVRAVPDHVVENAPTIEAEPVRHGRWVKQWCDNNMIGHEYAECCICGCSMLDTNQFWNSKYCPHCGAKMDGDSHEG